jgi:hypothetical protein
LADDEFGALEGGRTGRGDIDLGPRQVARREFVAGCLRRASSVPVNTSMRAPSGATT